MRIRRAPALDVNKVASEFLDSIVQGDLPAYSLWSLYQYGIAFTTYEDELEAKYGKDSISAIASVIHAQIPARYEKLMHGKP